MKLITQLLTLSLIFCFSLSTQAVPVSTSSAPVQEEAYMNDMSLNDLTQISREDIEAQLGRKLTIGERVSLAVMKRKAKKAAKKAGRDFEETKTDGLAIAALVLGILGFFTFLVCSILAVIFGSIAKRRIEENPELKGYGMAQAGYVLGIIALALAALGLIIILLLLATGVLIF
ncbi:MAG: DUF4190 domain-containing protein [Bacteroidetes bacterium]|nr:DUF4190 domain-containing protein [Bacteroidota bacterium]